MVGSKELSDLSTWEFFDLVLNNKLNLAYSFFLSSLLYYLVIRYVKVFPLDPFGFQIFISSFSFVVLIFLYLQGFVTTSLLFSLFSIYAFFILGFGRLKRISNAVTWNILELRIIYSYFTSFYGFVLGLTLITFGLPIFMESRVEMTSSDSGVYRILPKLLFYSRNISAFLTVYFIFFEKRFKMRVAYLVLIVLLFEALTSGSKSGLIFLVLFYGLIISIKQMRIVNRGPILFLFFLVVGSILLITTYIYGDSSILLYRSVMSGDIFYYVLPDLEYWSSNFKIGYSAIWPSVSKLMGVVSIDSPGFNLGNDINYFFYGVENMGPTRRLSIFLYLNLGLMISCILGFLLGLALSYLYAEISAQRSLVNVFIILLPMYFSIYDVDSDYPHALSKVLDTMLIILFVLPSFYIFRWLILRLSYQY